MLSFWKAQKYISSIWQSAHQNITCVLYKRQQFPLSFVIILEVLSSQITETCK